MSGATIPILASESRALEYRPQIDALRALAVSAVVIQHFLPGQYWLTKLIPWGGLGVRLFFVISGYLITGIILREKQLVARGEWGTWSAAKRFYLRRFLRIFPIFYLTIFVATVADFENMRGSFFWHVTYLSNFWVAPRGWILPGHFWSLAVEEQFYLIWPWLILLVPMHLIKKVCWGSIIVAMMYRFVVIKSGGWLWATVMMPGCLDTLAAGALLATYHLSVDIDERLRVQYWLRWGALLGLVGFLSLWMLLIYEYKLWGIYDVLTDVFQALVFVWLVDRCARGIKGPMGKILVFSPILYIGRISYGVYLIHQLMPEPLHRLFTTLNWPYPVGVWSKFWFQTIATLVVATLSWYLFEKPINDLKRFFPYHASKKKMKLPVAEGINV